MYSRMEKNHGQKVQRFSIRKYSFGAASVAVAAYMMFGGAATVDANGITSTTTDKTVNTNAGNPEDSNESQALTETATPTAEQPATPAPEVAQPSAPAEPSKGYKVPDNFEPTDKFGKTPIQYAPGIQKATVNFVSVDADGKETPLDEKFNINVLSGKAGTQIPEDDIQARLDVLKSMGYTVKENPFDQDPIFESLGQKDSDFRNSLL